MQPPFFDFQFSRFRAHNLAYTSFSCIVQFSYFFGLVCGENFHHLNGYFKKLGIVKIILRPKMGNDPEKTSYPLSLSFSMR